MIFKSVTMLIYALITAFIIPWINSKVDAETMAKIMEYAEILVRSAEQIFKTDEYNCKKQYVTTQLTRKLNEIGIEMTADALESVIESTVNYVKYGTEYTRGDE